MLGVHLKFRYGVAKEFKMIILRIAILFSAWVGSSSVWADSLEGFYRRTHPSGREDTMVSIQRIEQGGCDGYQIVSWESAPGREVFSGENFYCRSDSGVTIRKNRVSVKDLRPYDLEQGLGDQVYFLDPRGHLVIRHIVFSYWQWIPFLRETQDVLYYRVGDSGKKQPLVE